VERAVSTAASGSERALSVLDAQARPALRSLVEDLEQRRANVRAGGGAEKVAKQHERGKLTARERLALLIDEDTFVELGMHGRPHFSQRAMEGSRRRPTVWSPATAGSTGGSSRRPPTTQRSWPARWG
jgi:hypothetical protein